MFISLKQNVFENSMLKNGMHSEIGSFLPAYILTS